MIKILTFTSLYPNSENPHFGIFVENRLLQVLKRFPVYADVIAPVPWFPFKNRIFGKYSKFAKIAAKESRSEVAIFHPRYIHVPKYGMLISPFLMAFCLLCTLKFNKKLQNKYDLIDAHYFYPDGVAAVIVGSLLKIPVIITARGSDINEISKFMLPRYLMVLAGKKARKIIAVSEALKNKMQSIGIPDLKISIVRNGVDLKLFNPNYITNKIQKQNKLNKKIILSVGNLVKLKGHDIIIGALPYLTEFELIIIGHGPEEIELKKISAKYNVKERVKFLGSVPQDKLVYYYCLADMLILASSREGFPNVLLEAIACDTPIIATNVGGVPEIIKDKKIGIILHDRSSDSVVKAVRQVISYKREPGKIRDIAEMFSWEKTSEELYRIFKEIISI